MPKNFWDIMRNVYAPAQENKRIRQQLQNMERTVPTVQQQPFLPPSPTTQAPVSDQPTLMQRQDAEPREQEQQDTDGPLRETSDSQNNEKKKQVIGYAARNLLRLELQYNGIPRKVDAYSYKMMEDFTMDGKRRVVLGMKEMFYGKCSICGRVNSFDLRKIQKVRVLDEPYYPSYDVEIK